jgi:uncharacterized protein (TIGR02996 family)
MSEEDALLAAIAAHPDEDTPRLAYADRLDEHDRHVRAEFIRVQIDISHKDTLPRVLQNRYIDVWKRNQELIDTHRVELLGPLAVLPKDTVPIDFRRGFLSELTLDAERFLEHADYLATLKPRPEVAVWDAAHWLLQGQLQDATSAAVITSLHMQSDRRPELVAVDALGLHIWLTESGPWTRLRELNLKGCGTGDEGLRQIAYDHEADLPALTDLDLSGNGITDDGVLSLVNSALWPRLKDLVLGGNPIGDRAATILAEAPASGLEHLNLRFTAIGQPGHPGQQALLRRFGGRIALF